MIYNYFFNRKTELKNFKGNPKNICCKTQTYSAINTDIYNPAPYKKKKTFQLKNIYLQIIFFCHNYVKANHKF